MKKEDLYFLVKGDIVNLFNYFSKCELNEFIKLVNLLFGTRKVSAKFQYHYVDGADDFFWVEFDDEKKMIFRKAHSLSDVLSYNKKSTGYDMLLLENEMDEGSLRLLCNGFMKGQIAILGVRPFVTPIEQGKATGTIVAFNSPLLREEVNVNDIYHRMLTEVSFCYEGIQITSLISLLVSLHYDGRKQKKICAESPEEALCHVKRWHKENKRLRWKGKKILPSEYGMLLEQVFRALLKENPDLFRERQHNTKGYSTESYVSYMGKYPMFFKMARNQAERKWQV